MTTDAEILALEERMPLWSGRKEVAIRELGSHPAKYFSRLNRLVRTPEVVAAHPQLCRRVQERSSKRRSLSLLSTPEQ